MKNSKILALFMCTALLLSSLFAFNLYADDDDDDENEGHRRWYNIFGGKGDHDDDEKEGKGGREGGYNQDRQEVAINRKHVKPVELPLYQKECGACHMAYQPGLLPSRSWKAIMDGLEDHFGDNAALQDSVKTELLQYMTANAGEFSNSKRSMKLMRSIGNATPLRISDIPYLKHEHGELPPKVFERASIKTVANCKACHTTADRGVYSERYIHVPQ